MLKYEQDCCMEMQANNGNYFYQPPSNSCICIVNQWKISILQTFCNKYRPFTDPKVPKGLYYRPRSVNTDPLGNPADPKA